MKRTLTSSYDLSTVRTCHGSLYKYQKDAVLWMRSREESSDRFGIRGGMLCDDMGLGKTRTCLSLIRLHPVQTLIVCP